MLLSVYMMKKLFKMIQFYCFIGFKKIGYHTSSYVVHLNEFEIGMTEPHSKDLLIIINE